MSSNVETKSVVVGQQEREVTNVDRRSFIKSSLASAGIVACAGSISAMLTSCEDFTVKPAESGFEGFEVDLSLFPELSDIGGVSFVDVGVNNGGKPVIVLRLSESECVTITSVCTHDPCVPDPRDYMQLPNNADTTLNIDDVVHCACHQSKFKVRSGEVVQGPAVVPLQSFPCSLNTNTMVLTIQF